MEVVMPPVVPGERLRISASTFVAWKKCPETANSRFQGKYGPDSRVAFVGGLAHRVFSRHLNSGPIPEEDFVQACREEIGQSNLNNKMGGLGITTSSLSGMIEEVRSLYSRFVRFPGTGFEGAEVALTFEPAPGVELVGTVDAVYRRERDGPLLVDWKTGSSLDDADDQLGFYALLWVLERDELPSMVEAISVSTGESYTATPTTASVQGVADQVASMVSVLRASWADGSALERSAGPWCRYCPVLEDCPEGQAVEAMLS
jgi:hypothetical protein